MARVRLALVAVITLVAIAGCGGSSSVKPEAYVKSVCVALGNWRNTIQSAAAALQSSGASGASRSVAREDYQRFVASLVTATRRAAASLHAAGSPSVPGGNRVASRLTGAFDRAAARLERAEARAGRIPTDTAANFRVGATAVSNDIRAGLEQIATATPGQSQQLRAAAARESACQLLAGG